MVLIRERPGPAAWQAGELSAEWRFVLPEQDCAELLTAVDRAVGAGGRPADLAVAGFPLPGFGSVSYDPAAAISSGSGWAI